MRHVCVAVALSWAEAVVIVESSVVEYMKGKVVESIISEW